MIFAGDTAVFDFVTSASGYGWIVSSTGPAKRCNICSTSRTLLSPSHFQRTGDVFMSSHHLSVQQFRAPI